MERVPGQRGGRRLKMTIAGAAASLLAVAGVAGFGLGRSTASSSDRAPVSAAAPAATRVLAANPSRTATQIAAAAVPGVVSITSSQAGVAVGTSGGTGFVIDKAGRIVTNHHVVNGSSAVHVSFADGTKARARILAEDPLLDLAVIKVDVPSSVLKPLALGSSDDLELGDPVMAIGNPFGLERSVSVGVVSALRRQITAPNRFTLSNAIQTDAAINHGNSGGPLLDASGRVVGVNAQIADSGVNANVGVGFAVAVDPAVKRAIATMAQGRKVAHPWLGVSIDEVDAVLGTSSRVRSNSGVLLTGIVPGGPAGKAGLRGGSTVAQIEGSQYCLDGDIVTRVDGTKVITSGEFMTAVNRNLPGETVQLTVVRASGETKTVSLKLGTQPASPPGSTGCR